MQLAAGPKRLVRFGAGGDDAAADAPVADVIYHPEGEGLSTVAKVGIGVGVLVVVGVVVAMVRS